MGAKETIREKLAFVIYGHLIFYVSRLSLYSSSATVALNENNQNLPSGEKTLAVKTVHKP